MVIHKYLDSLFLSMPTMGKFMQLINIEINRGDDEDTEDEEEVLIAQRKIEVSGNQRKLFDAPTGQGVIPVTISVLGYDGAFLGIRITVFN
jgi:hypothetical protein